jgi:LysR family transcriptional activator of nhaA
MEWINYHHLLYFWVVAKEGGLVAAARVLRLSHPTLSTQIHALEDQLDARLFEKRGRTLELTETGRVVFRYADEIFSLGREMTDVVKGRDTGKPPRLSVGIVDAVPKSIVVALLEPALSLKDPPRLLCSENRFDRLLTELAAHTLDLVISDAPVPPGSPVRAFNHLLGESGVSFFAKRELAKSLRRDFPRALHGAPMLLPMEGSSLRRSLGQWFDRQQVRPKIVAELEDGALLKAFGAGGLGVFPGPSVMEATIEVEQGVQVVGRADRVRERFYAISPERRLKNPAVLAISEAARHQLFAAEVS